MELAYGYFVNSTIGSLEEVRKKFSRRNEFVGALRLFGDKVSRDLGVLLCRWPVLGKDA